jgi:VanZ family protein
MSHYAGPKIPTRWRWLTWYLFVVVWTALLVVPDPTPAGFEELPVDLRFLFAKSAHCFGYAAFAALTGWLRTPPRFRLALVILLMAHGPATELIQSHLSSRTGRLEDVVLDHFGVGLGIALSWKWWSSSP